MADGGKLVGVGHRRRGLERLRGGRPDRQWRRKLLAALVGGKYGSPALGLGEMLSLARRGFLPVSSVLYDLARVDAESYLTDYEHELTFPINGSARGALDDKVLFSYLMDGMGVPVPKIRAIVAHGEPRWLGVPSRAIDEKSLRDRLAHGPLAIKPVAARGGRDFNRLTLFEEGFLLNEHPLKWKGVDRFLRRLEYFMATDHVEQAEYSSTIFPPTTNTIRVLTVWPGGADEPAIVAAVHRIGTTSSRPVDNWVRGGLSANVDLDTGELSRAAAASEKGKRVWHASHPETGAQIEGVQLTEWEEIRRIILRGAKGLSFLPYIAWDVIATNEGGGVVIEGNNFTSVDVFQVHGGLLENRTLRAFYEEHRVLRR